MANAAVFQHLNPILIGIVGANVQGSTQLLLATHAVNIWSFLVAKFVYCFALVAHDRSRAGQQNQENYSRFWSLIAFVFGSLSSVSLVSTLVPRSAGSIILYIAWICAAIAIVVYQCGRLVTDGCRWLYSEILKFFINSWNRIEGNNTAIEMTEQPRPAV